MTQGERETLFRVGFGENSRNGGNLLYTSLTNSVGCGQLTKRKGKKKKECSSCENITGHKCNISSARRELSSLSLLSFLSVSSGRLCLVVSFLLLLNKLDNEPASTCFLFSRLNCERISFCTAQKKCPLSRETVQYNVASCRASFFFISTHYEKKSTVSSG